MEVYHLRTASKKFKMVTPPVAIGHTNLEETALQMEWTGIYGPRLFLYLSEYGAFGKWTLPAILIS